MIDGSFFTQGYWAIGRIRIAGARLYVHWSVALVTFGLMAMSWRQPAIAALTIACYIGVILLHEWGHAVFATRRGYEATAIHLALLHGTCTCEGPGSRFDAALIAWGGVVAQMAVALPLIALERLTPLGSLPYLGTVIAFFGYYSLMVALLNLAPARGLDGVLAWQMLPLWRQERRARCSARSAATNLIRRARNAPIRGDADSRTGLP